MPLATLHLISLRPSSTLLDIVNAIRTSSPSHQPIILSKPIRWIITPELIDTKLLLSPSKPWDLLYIHVGTEPLPPQITTHISDHYTLQTGIPSRLLQNFTTTNHDLLHPPPLEVPKLTGALDNPLLSTSSQDLSLSKPLRDWISLFSQSNAGQSAVSMLNLLSFKPGLKESYITYGREFAQSIGSKRGGNAKLVGHVVYPQQQQQPATSEKPREQDQSSPRWEEFALAHYPSILHFADMLASRDYQDVNRRFRVPALKDTCILCTSEIEIEDLLGGVGGMMPKL